MRARSHVLMGIMLLSIIMSCSGDGDLPPSPNNELKLGGINRYYITRQMCTIDPGYLSEKVELGDGIDMSNPLSPQVALGRALKKQESVPLKGGGLPKSSDVIQEIAVFKESLTEEEESNILSAYFKASYMLSSAEGAYEKAKEERKSYHTIYVLIEHSGESDVLPHDLPEWRSGEVPLSESIADPNEALLQFLSTYGSHYVSGIHYGLRIAIQGKMKKESESTYTDFSAKVKAAFGEFGAEAGVRNQHKQALDAMQVDLLLEVTSGGRVKGPAQVAIKGFESISAFLDSLNADAIQFSVAPIELTIRSYWPTLNQKWKRTRALLNPEAASFKTPGAPFGVPKGTIIAWHPTPDYIVDLDKGLSEATIAAPPGWAICDGTQGTPDLRNRFIRGTTKYTSIGQTGGAETHDHGGKTLGPSETIRTPGGGTAHNMPYETHTHDIRKSKHLPPYVELVYIMKLEDLP